MEISESTISIFFISKLLALGPYSIRKNSNGSFEIRRSILFSLYSATVILTMVCLTYRGLIFDANSKIPVRMTSATSKVVTALDVSVVVLATAAGAACGLMWGYRATCELNIRLRKIDESLHSFSNYKRDRWYAIMMLMVPFVFISILLALDLQTRLRCAESMKIDHENTERNIQWYMPFYILYLILTGLHISFANTVFGLGRRYRRLNLLLKSTFLPAEKKKEPTPVNPKITTVKTITSTPPPFIASETKPSLDNFYVDNVSKTKGLLLRLMAENHESLGKCLSIVSGSYGIAVLFILVSCLLHLVATAYFLLLELLSKRDFGYFYLQILWIIFHTFRLLMVVEPCHMVANEAKKTIQIVCEIERKIHDPILAEEVKKLWQQLLVVDCQFSASGLCRVNRKILTSISSAIATYLVILMQFNKD